VALLRACAAIALLAVAAHAGVKVGDALPDFRVERLAGGTLGRADLAGKVAVVDFWASWCLPCREALPALDALARRMRNRVTVVAIGVDRERGTAERWAAEHLPAPALALAHDGAGGLMQRFGAPAMPSMLVVDCEGVVRRVESGWSPEKAAALAEAVEALLAGPCARR
jgi:thiol-disulfide isomerase/thioredoxin